MPANELTKISLHSKPTWDPWKSNFWPQKNLRDVVRPAQELDDRIAELKNVLADCWSDLRRESEVVGCSRES